MNVDPKKFDLEHWWKMLAGAGAAITVASVAVKFPATTFIGLGLLAAGIGEWINHPYREFVSGGLYKLTGHPRSPTIAGLLFDTGGVVLLTVGLVKMALA